MLSISFCLLKHTTLYVYWNVLYFLRWANKILQKFRPILGQNRFGLNKISQTGQILTFSRSLVKVKADYFVAYLYL